jgi:NTP pyrophosphatase (non-canonical NTP hydrolase)
MSGQPMDLRQAVNILHRYRHQLSPDILRTIQDVWVCACAARCGEPYETGWADDPDVYREHDVSECEADDTPAALVGALETGAGPAPQMELQGIAIQLDHDLRANRCPGITDANQLDVQALCVAEEAGELVGAYRRYAGKARLAGTLREVEDEVAYVLIVTAVFAERAGIDINAAVARKLTVIYSRGWREDQDE